MTPLTPAQRRMAQYIIGTTALTRQPCTIRSIARGMGYSSISYVYYLCNELVRKGVISMEWGAQRSIRPARGVTLASV